MENDILKTIQGRALGWGDQQPQSGKRQDGELQFGALQGRDSYRVSFWAPPRGHVSETASLLKQLKGELHYAQIRCDLPASVCEETKNKGNTMQVYKPSEPAWGLKNSWHFSPFYVSECTLAHGKGSLFAISSFLVLLQFRWHILFSTNQKLKLQKERKCLRN